MNAERVLVTGANGFLGQAIVRSISSKFSVVASGRQPRANLGMGIDYVSADLLSDDLGRLLPSSIDTIIHVAGVTGGRMQALAQNIEMTRNIVNWAKKVDARRLVLISSASVYSRSDGINRESSKCQPQTAYGQSKLESEQYAIAATSDSDMCLVILRKPALLGPTRNGSVAKLIRALDRGKFVLIGDGSNRKSLIDVGDAGRACLAALEYSRKKRSRNGYDIFNVSGGELAMIDIVRLVCQEQGRGMPPQLPPTLARATLKTLKTITFGARPFSELLNTVEQFLSNDVLDASLICEEMGFEPTVKIQNALREMVLYQI